MNPNRRLCTLLAIAVSATVGLPHARATFNYDLRFAQSQIGINGVKDSYNCYVPVAGATYTVQLWGQIFNNSNLNDGFNGGTGDGWVDGYVGIESRQANPGFPFITSGGVQYVNGLPASAQTPHFGVNIQTTSSYLGTPADLNGDGLTDWGGSSTTTSAGWMTWLSGSPPGYSLNLDNNYPNFVESEKVAGTTNGWEILIATFKIYVGTVRQGFGLTSYNILYPSTGVTQGFNTAPPVDFYQDDPGIVAGNPPTTHQLFTATVSQGINFQITDPEPASRTLLVAGSLAFLSRRAPRPRAT